MTHGGQRWLTHEGREDDLPDWAPRFSPGPWPLPGSALAQAPRLGEIQKVQVVTISMQVGSTEQETRQVTYTPPPGWYIRSHQVHCTARHGNSSFTVSTVPRKWDWLSEEKASESCKLLIDVAGKSHAAELQAKCTQQREALLEGLRRVRVSHHALVVEATARGEGFLRGGGCIELTVTAELVYLGMEETLPPSAGQHKASAR